MQMGPRAQARAAHPAEHLPLQHAITGADIQLRQVAIEAAAPRPLVLHLHRQAIATGQTAADHPTRQGRHHRCALGGSQVLAGMETPAPQQGMQPPTKTTRLEGGADDRQQQTPVAIARHRRRPRGHTKHLGQVKTPTQERRDRNREGRTPCPLPAQPPAQGDATAAFPRREGAGAAALLKRPHIQGLQRGSAPPQGPPLRWGHDALPHQGIEGLVKALRGRNRLKLLQGRPQRGLGRRQRRGFERLRAHRCRQEQRREEQPTEPWGANHSHRSRSGINSRER